METGLPAKLANGREKFVDLIMPSCARRRAEQAAALQPTFHPAILPGAAARPARGVANLSEGDRLRRAYTHVRSAKAAPSAACLHSQHSC